MLFPVIPSVAPSTSAPKDKLRATATSEQELAATPFHGWGLRVVPLGWSPREGGGDHGVDLALAKGWGSARGAVDVLEKSTLVLGSSSPGLARAGAQPSRCTRWCCSRLEG